MVNISNLPSNFASVVVVLYYFYKKRKRETVTGRRGQTDYRTINTYCNAYVYMQASLFMITQMKFQISFIQECRDADRTIRRGRLMEGNLRLCLCPRGGDEERKQTTVGDLKIPNNDPEYFKNVCNTFPPQLR